MYFCLPQNELYWVFDRCCRRVESGSSGFIPKLAYSKVLWFSVRSSCCLKKHSSVWISRRALGWLSIYLHVLFFGKVISVLFCCVLPPVCCWRLNPESKLKMCSESSLHVFPNNDEGRNRVGTSPHRWMYVYGVVGISNQRLFKRDDYSLTGINGLCSPGK